MNYVAKHDYLKCKFNGGPGCENFRKQNTIPKILSGYLIDKNENIITLVKQYDPNKDKDIYFLRKKTNENNYYLDDIEFKQNRLYNNDTLTIDGIDYTVNMTDDYDYNFYELPNMYKNNYNNQYPPLNYWNNNVHLSDQNYYKKYKYPIYRTDYDDYYDSNYINNHKNSYPYDYMNDGIVDLYKQKSDGVLKNESTNQLTEVYVSYKDNKYIYSKKIDDVLIPLHETKDVLYDDDKISINSIDYTFMT